MSKLRDYIFSAPGKVYTDPVCLEMLPFYRAIGWSWMVIYVTHIWTWSLFSMDQLWFFNRLGYFSEIEMMIQDDVIGPFAASHAELMACMIPYFILNTILIIGMLINKAKVLIKRDRNMKHEFPLMFFGVMFFYWLTMGLLFSSTPVFYVDYNTDVAQLPIWLTAFLKTVLFPAIAIGASEFIWNPRSKVLSKF